MSRQKTNKTKLTLTVDKNLIESAKEININLSAFLELKLREYLSVLKNGFRGYSQADPAGFEPAIYGLEGRRPIHARPRAHIAVAVTLWLKEI